MQAQSVLVELAYATVPAWSSVQAICSHRERSHAQRLGGDATCATVPASAGVHRGNADDVAAVSATEYSPMGSEVGPELGAADSQPANNSVQTTFDVANSARFLMCASPFPFLLDRFVSAAADLF
jgi:hypothetical protein